MYQRICVSDLFTSENDVWLNAKLSIVYLFCILVFLLMCTKKILIKEKKMFFRKSIFFMY